MQYPREVRRKYGRGDEHCDEMTRFVRLTTRVLVAEQLVISLRQPFRERDKKSHLALVSTRLAIVSDPTVKTALELVDWEVDAAVEIPDLPQPPLVCARTPHGPPISLLAHSCRVKEMLTV